MSNKKIVKSQHLPVISRFIFTASSICNRGSSCYKVIGYQLVFFVSDLFIWQQQPVFLPLKRDIKSSSFASGTFQKNNQFSYLVLSTNEPYPKKIKIKSKPSFK